MALQNLGDWGSSLPSPTLLSESLPLLPSPSLSLSAGFHHTARDGRGGSARKEGEGIPISSLYHLKPFGNLKTGNVGRGCRRCVRPE